MNTKFIKIAIIAAVFIGLGLRQTPSLAGGEAAVGIKLSSVTTLSGSVYKEVEVLTADRLGLLFRHSNGTAKVDFADLSANLREMFEPASTEEPVPDNNNGNDADAAAMQEEEGGYEELEIETRTQITINIPPHYGCHSTCCNPFNPRTVNWQPQWGRYHYGLSYANFYCRQAAERELLIRSGFLR